MKSNTHRPRNLILHLGSLLIFAGVISGSTASSAEKIRVGWQVPWAIQGQLVQIMKHTDVSKRSGFAEGEIEFIGKSFGPELNELAIGKSVDIILTGDQPALVLFSKSTAWKAVGRLMYNRTATYVPVKSSIKTVADLKGKTVGLPVGAAAQRIFEQELVRIKLDPKTDVKLVNLGIQEQVPLVLKSPATADRWDQFDALAGFDPIPATLESRHLARMIHVGKVCALIVASDELAAKHPETIRKFLKAVTLAYEFYRQNPKQANQWFRDESRLKDVTDEALKTASSLEPALNGGEVRISFNDEDREILRQAAKFVESTNGGKKIRTDYLNTDFTR